eukprot:Rhum_TRINITY_DN14754_c0_g1::Rhum_TRINITY_DN14754_c0_g1_i3::g.113146::m.113146
MSHAYGQLSESSDNEQTEVEMSRGEGESGAESDRSDPVAVSDRAYLIGTAAEEGSRVERVRDRVCKGLQDVGAWAHTHGTRCLVRVLECEVKALFALLAAALVLFPLVLTLVQARIEDGDARLHARITQLERQQRHDTAAKDAVVAALREEIAALRQTVQTMSETVDAQRIESEANTKLTTTNNATLAAVFSDSTQHGNDLAALQQTVQKMSEAANAQRVVSEANKKLADANSDTLSAAHRRKQRLSPGELWLLRVGERLRRPREFQVQARQRDQRRLLDARQLPRGQEVQIRVLHVGVLLNVAHQLRLSPPWSELSPDNAILPPVVHPSSRPPAPSPLCDLSHERSPPPPIATSFPHAACPHGLTNDPVLHSLSPLLIAAHHWRPSSLTLFPCSTTHIGCW